MDSCLPLILVKPFHLCLQFENYHKTIYHKSSGHASETKNITLNWNPKGNLPISHDALHWAFVNSSQVARKCSFPAPAVTGEELTPGLLCTRMVQAARYPRAISIFLCLASWLDLFSILARIWMPVWAPSGSVDLLLSPFFDGLCYYHWHLNRFCFLAFSWNQLSLCHCCHEEGLLHGGCDLTQFFASL